MAKKQKGQNEQKPGWHDRLYKDTTAAIVLGVQVETIRRRCREGKAPGAVEGKQGWQVRAGWLSQQQKEMGKGSGPRVVRSVVGNYGARTGG